VKQTLGRVVPVFHAVERSDHIEAVFGEVQRLSYNICDDVQVRELSRTQCGPSQGEEADDDVTNPETDNSGNGGPMQSGRRSGQHPAVGLRSSRSDTPKNAVEMLVNCVVATPLGFIEEMDRKRVLPSELGVVRRMPQ
jgi:hypothetical protein